MCRDIPGRNGNIAMEDWHPFGTSRAPARVQDQSNVIPGWGGGKLPLRRADDPRKPRAVRFEQVYGNPPRLSRLPCCDSVVAKTEQDPGARVFQVETHLIFPITGIERRGGSGYRSCQEAHYRVQAVR